MGIPNLPGESGDIPQARPKGLKMDHRQTLKRLPDFEIDKDAVYEGKLHELRHKRRWNYEERQCLMSHLSQFHWLDRMNHLDTLHTVRKHKINYNSSQGRTWAIDVELFMSGRRIRTDVTNDIEILRRKNNSITREMQQEHYSVAARSAARSGASSSDASRSSSYQN
jgi:hypothetical protein